MGFVSGAASDLLLFEQARELDPIARRPAALQADEKFEFAACEYRHGKAGMLKSGRRLAKRRYTLCIPA
jgi:hypothetical protein